MYIKYTCSYSAETFKTWLTVKTTPSTWSKLRRACAFSIVHFVLFPKMRRHMRDNRKIGLDPRIHKNKNHIFFLKKL